MTETFDVIVIGVGAMGAATCRSLARRGARVLGLEQFDLVHDLGSSGGHTRLIRMAYFESPEYVPLLRRAYRGWDELAARIGESLFVRNGLLYVGPDDGSVFAGVRRSSTWHGVRLEEVPRDEVPDRFPLFHVPENHAALFEPDAGFVFAEAGVAALVDDALAAGAVVHAREPVRRIEERGRGVRVETDRDAYEADHVVATAGAWTAKLLQDLGVPLVVTRQPIGWVSPRHPELFTPERLPCFAFDDPDVDGIYYGFPRVHGRPGVKIGRHEVGPSIDPDRVDRTPTPADEAGFRPALVRYLPAADGPLLGIKVCMYTMTPDQHFILDRHPGRERMTLGAGFSGHGFKFAPAIGDALADLALDGRTESPIEFLRLTRFVGFPT